MIIIITGASHTGKTALAQRLLEKYHYPYLSIDHLKMGLIRTKNTNLTPLSDDKDLTEYLWPIVREMIKTAIENKQNLIVEGCYVPLSWSSDFDDEYLKQIEFYCLAMTENYIRNNFSKIEDYANVIENRLCDDLNIDEVINDNLNYINGANSFGQKLILIDNEYKIEI